MSQAYEKFKMLSTTEDTVKDIIRKLNYVLYRLETGGSVDIKDDTIKSLHIDFGLGETQVKAADIPIADTGGLYTEVDIEGALAEIATIVNSITAADIPIEDEAELYTATNTEDALAEVMTDLDNLTAADIPIEDEAELYTSTNVEDALAEVVGDIGDLTAADIPIIDTGGLYTATETESALAEVMTDLNTHKLSSHEGDKIIDANSNEFVIFTASENAVNEVTIENAITMESPVFKSSGNDDNIDLTLEPKGTGEIILNGNLKHGSTGNETLGFFGGEPAIKTTVTDPADFVVTDGEIAALTFSGTPTKTEVEALRDKCEALADDCRTLRNELKGLIDVLQGYGLV